MSRTATNEYIGARWQKPQACVQATFPTPFGKPTLHTVPYERNRTDSPILFPTENTPPPPHTHKSSRNYSRSAAASARRRVLESNERPTSHTGFPDARYGSS